MECEFVQMCSRYCNKEELVQQAWNEIVACYSEPARCYHNLNHLEALRGELEAVRSFINSWGEVMFALYYHDIVYNVLRNDNEKQSAILAAQKMQQMGMPAMMTDRVRELILATKSHTSSHNTDVNYFTDADLSILGKDRETYMGYTQHVRREYGIYPALLYRPGRKKVLQHFLQMKRIYKTDWFYEKYESSARANMQAELDSI
jgi:predicted metal-dependent HD superfamily phosphohydrolase